MIFMDDSMDAYPRRPCCRARIFMDDAMDDYPKVIMLRYENFHG